MCVEGLTHVKVSWFVNSRESTNSQSTIFHYTSVSKVVDIRSNPTTITSAKSTIERVDIELP